ncbi:transporter, major facilitator family protein [Ditylenchus destructor]|nr:transporter, major facilitator family protein [Ditylenchus destructor]
MAAVLFTSPERKFRTACNAAPTSTSSDSSRLLRLICTGAIVVLGGSFHFGYQISIINPMADVLQSFIENGLTQL